MPLVFIYDGGPPNIYGATITPGKIQIYWTAKRTGAEIRRTIRHEMLHSILQQAGLPAHDADEAFILKAAYYDADPYILASNEPGAIKAKISLIEWVMASLKASDLLTIKAGPEEKTITGEKIIEILANNARTLKRRLI